MPLATSWEDITFFSAQFCADITLGHILLLADYVRYAIDEGRAYYDTLFSSRESPVNHRTALPRLIFEIAVIDYI